MITRTLPVLFLLATSLCSSAQAPFSKWLVQSGDSVNVYGLGRSDLALLSNGDLLNCTCRDEVGSMNKCRFVRTSSDGDPLQQWEVNAPYFDINKVIENDDGSFACFGRLNYSALYLKLASDGTVLIAKSYDVFGLGITAPWTWNDAVRDPGQRFTLAGIWGGMDNTGMIARIEADGSLIASNLIHIGTAGNTDFTSIARLANGDHVFAGSSNYAGSHAKSYLFRSDSLLTPQWAKAYPDSGHAYTEVKLLVLPGDQFRLVLRNGYAGSVSGPLIVVTNSNGTPLWAKRRLPQPDYPSMVVWPKTAVLVDNNSIVLAGSPSSGVYDPFVEVLNTNGDEIAMGELDIPTPIAGCPGADGDLYLAGMNHGPLGSSSLSVGITKLGLDLGLCGTVSHSTSFETWFPSVETDWSSTSATVTVTDVLSQFTSYPTSAYSQIICLSTAVNEVAEAPMTIAPNPAHDLVHVSGSAIEQMEIVDATGRVMLSRSFRNEAHIDLDIRSLTIGLHYLRIKTGDGWQCSKVIKE